MNIKYFLFKGFIFFSLFLLSACQSDTDNSSNVYLPQVSRTKEISDSDVSERKKISEILKNPKHPEMNRQSPETYQVLVETTKGYFVVEVYRRWSPAGADRFYNLVRHGFYDETRFFRVIKKPEKFIAQFGISGIPEVAKIWSTAGIEDETIKYGNLKGTLSFAKTAQPNSRDTQIFINYADNRYLDAKGFVPFGKVIEGMKSVNRLYGGYGESVPKGSGPHQSHIERFGNKFLEERFPKLDWITRAIVVE